MKTLELEKSIFEPFHWSIIFSVASSCVWRLFLFATFDIGIDVFAGLESLFKTNHEVNTINNHLDQWEFRETKTISVGNIEHTTFGGCVDTTLKFVIFEPSKNSGSHRDFELSKRSIQIFGDLPVPLFWSLSLPRRLSNSGWTESFSSFMWTPARTPVPKFSLIIWIWKLTHLGFSFQFGIFIPW